MKGVNKAILIGNLGQDPEVKFTAGGTAVCNLRLACNGRKKEGDQWVDAVEWINVVVFGKTAENCGEYLKKGRPLYVEGRIQTRQWEDRDGGKRYTTEVVANDVVFLGGREDSAPRASSPGRDDPPPIDDSDIPF